VFYSANLRTILVGKSFANSHLAISFGMGFLVLAHMGQYTCGDANCLVPPNLFQLR
jgi:hypothetical protein